MASADGGRIKAAIPLPRTSRYQRLLTEEVRSGPLRFSITESDGSRRGEWQGRLNGSTKLSYQAAIDVLSYDRELPATDTERSYAKSIAGYLGESPSIPVNQTATVALSDELGLRSDDKAVLARQIFDFITEEVGARDEPTDVPAVIQEGRGDESGRARLYCALARYNELPCRVLVGVPLVTGRGDELRYWNEVYAGKDWVPIDLTQRRLGSLPPDRLAFGPSLSDEFVEASGITGVSYRFHVQAEFETYVELLRRRVTDSQHFLDRISLLFLPVEMQGTLRVLLLVPLGALVMCFLRNVIGLRTFGMFMPMLIALAMTGTGLAWGTTFLVMIVTFALLSRLWIQRLYLLLAARIAFILTLVVLGMIVLLMIGDRLDFPTEGVGAFPFVIMTMIVERISVTLEEEGFNNTLRRIGSTLFCIYVTYSVLHFTELQTGFLVFPEALLVILALLIAIGRYTGYRLTELVRFREFGQEP
jgi:transglutaminase-like putative cysteine protease